MRTDALFTLHQYTIETVLDRPEFLVPVSDIHHDNECHAAHEFDSFLEYMARERRGAYCLGVADYLDFIRAHNRSLIDRELGDIDEIREILNNNAKYEVTRLSERLRGLKWIGLLGGNHYFMLRFKHRGGFSEMHSDAYLAKLLGTQYLGTCCGIELTLNDKKAKKSAKVHIIAHHGKGAATTIGGGLNRVQRFLSGWEADIALMGDNHQRGILPTTDKISFGGNKLSSRTRFVARTGSFLRGYVPDKSSYVTDMALTPSSIGWVEFEFRLKLNEQGKPYVAIRGIQ